MKSAASAASQNSQKRKSIEGESEDSENISPNSSIKKPRSKNGDESGGAAEPDQKIKSGLPRYQRAQPKLVAGSTPMKSKLRLPGTPLTATRRAGRRSSYTPRALIRICNDKIGTYFDDAFTVNENKIVEIMSTLKSKGKKAPFVDFKEKAKKYEAVIKELREALRTVLTEIPTLREKSVSHEAFITAMVAEMDADLQANHGQREAMKAKNNSLHEELEIVSSELKVSSVLAESLKREHSPLRNRTEEVESLYAELKKQFKEELAIRSIADTQFSQLKVKFAESHEARDVVEQLRKKVRDGDTSVSYVSSKSNLRSFYFNVINFYQEMEATVRSFTDEVSGLRSELGRREEEVDRGVAERAELDIRLEKMREELNTTHNSLRESINAVRYQEADSARVTNELERSAKQLEQKEADLRVTMASLTEERLAIRSDMGALQCRITLLEQERVEISSQLAGKREECLSTSRELAQQRDCMMALQSKVKTNLRII